jgi:UDP-N-acetylmuramoyl-tripeptide--D-alanyl-D-alanine ligase
VLFRSQKRVAVLGDMLELGRHTAPLHKKLGNRLAKAQVRDAVIVGQFSKTVAQGATAAGMSAKHIHTVDNGEDALAALKKIVQKGDTILLKASRGIKLETVYEGF